MKIKRHPKAPKYYQITEATPEAITRANELPAWGKVKGTTIVMHQNFIGDFERMARQETRNNTIAPRMKDWKELDKWAWANLNSAQAAEYIGSLPVQVFNRRFAGKAAAEINEYGKDF